jgi:hypothetical protein
VHKIWLKRNKEWEKWANREKEINEPIVTIRQGDKVKPRRDLFEEKGRTVIYDEILSYTRVPAESHRRSKRAIRWDRRRRREKRKGDRNRRERRRKGRKKRRE